MVPVACRKAPPRGGSAHQGNLTSMVKKQNAAFIQAEHIDKPKDNKPRVVRRAINKKGDIATLVSEKVNEGDIKGALRIKRSDDVIAPTPEKAEKLKAKHPTAPVDRRSFPSCNPEPIRVNQLQLERKLDGTTSGSNILKTRPYATQMKPVADC